jgi:hypothetical protein
MKCLIENLKHFRMQYCKKVLGVDCKTQGRLKFMICHKFQIPYKRA